MLAFEDVRDFLSEAADHLPREIYEGLNGGVILSPDEKFHPESRAEDLYVLGEYVHDPAGLGRYVVIYYGSLVQTCGGRSDEEIRREVRRVLHHELTHHLESLAGDRSLEFEDARAIARYRRRVFRRKK